MLLTKVAASATEAYVVTSTGRLTGKRSPTLSGWRLDKWTSSMSVLGELPYWSRLWITQELKLSSRAVLWLDRLRIAWFQIIAKVSQVSAVGRLGSELARCNMLRLVALAKEDNPLTIDQLLRLNVGFQYSEPLDVLYGGLGLLPNTGPRVMVSPLTICGIRVTSSGVLCSQPALFINFSDLGC